MYFYLDLWPDLLYAVCVSCLGAHRPSLLTARASTRAGKI